MVTGGGSYIANGLYNADCITAMRTMPNECVNMVLTDPPYNINFVPQRTAERGAILNDNLSVADFDKLLGDYFTECYPFKSLADSWARVSICSRVRSISPSAWSMA